MSTFVLVPGFWIGGWAWDRVAASLRAAGHRVEAVTLGGMDDPAATGIDLDSHIADVVGLIERADLREVVLAGHSYAGFVITGVADRIPDRIARLVYVDTGVVGDGDAHADFVEAAERDEYRAAVAEHGPDWRIPVRSWDRDADPELLAGLSDEDVALLGERAVGQPVGTSTGALHLKSPARRGLPTDMICCIFPVEAAEQMLAAGHPYLAEFATLKDARLHGLPTGHWPMLSRPDDLAALLASLA